MPHGLSGRPKSEQHKRRISEGVKRAARKHESDLWATKLQLTTILAQKDFPTAQALQDALVKAMAEAVKATASAMDVAEAQRQARLNAEDEIHELRGELRAADELWETGQRVKSVDSRDLVDLARKGLVDQRVVDKEMERRHRALPNPMHAIGNGVMSNFSVASGFSSQHPKTEPRIFLTLDHTPRNLDAEHEAAEERLRRAQGEIAAAEAKLKNIQTQIEAYDRAHPRD